jgi:CBS domain-containing membrane protein
MLVPPTPSSHSPLTVFFLFQVKPICSNFESDTPSMRPETTLKSKFKKLWKSYLLQSLLATAVLLIFVLVPGRYKLVVISAMGATVFIIFTMPRTVSTQRKNVIGGHLVGLASVAVFYFITLPYYLEYSLAVGLAILLTVTLDVEHPPAAGTALAVVINEVSLDASITIMLSAVILSQCGYHLRGYLKDLV